MQEVYVLLTDTGTWFTRMIRLYTRQPMNHASIAFDDTLSEVYSFGRKRPANPFIAGFVRERMDGPLFCQATCALYRCRIDPSSMRKLRAIIRHFELNRDRYKYNLTGLLGILFGTDRLCRENAFFCSQFVASVFDHAGVRLVNKPSGLVTPADIERSGRLMKVYEGPISAYLQSVKLGKRLPEVRLRDLATNDGTTILDLKHHGHQSSKGVGSFDNSECSQSHAAV